MVILKQIFSFSGMLSLHRSPPLSCSHCGCGLAVPVAVVLLVGGGVSAFPTLVTGDWSLLPHVRPLCYPSLLLPSFPLVVLLRGVRHISNSRGQEICGTGSQRNRPTRGKQKERFGGGRPTGWSMSCRLQDRSWCSRCQDEVRSMQKERRGSWAGCLETNRWGSWQVLMLFKWGHPCSVRGPNQNMWAGHRAAGHTGSASPLSSRWQALWAHTGVSWSRDAFLQCILIQPFLQLRVP